MGLPLAILALTVSAFGIGTSEFVINGLLPRIADDLHVSIPHAGLLISGFAAGIIAGAPTLTMMSLRLPRKTVLQTSLLLFIAGSALSSLAQTYSMLMIGRVVSAMAVGAFYGVGSVVAASLVALARKASAIALMFAGATAATVFGVPLGTLLGQEFGWRATYWVVTAIGIVGLFVGNYLGGRAADRRPMATLIALFAAFAVVLLMFGFTVHVPIAAVVTAFSFGVTGYALVPGAQLRVMSVANDAPTLASALNISAFNVGVTIGAALGAAAIDAKLGLASVTWIGAALASIGLALAIVSSRNDLRTDRYSCAPGI